MLALVIFKLIVFVVVIVLEILTIVLVVVLVLVLGFFVERLFLEDDDEYEDEYELVGNSIGLDRFTI